ncbi:MAG: hypothetical protein HYR72_01430 [Deltaproteobacteria bacterium]|nr:hypothetical protein [Deltaproteobacteria bacterium]MBI3391079.1 hypothetical protein [Deltaproteobacteria bacterium]
MTRPLPRLTLLLIGLAACCHVLGCADGGVGGSGISGSATVQGNIQDIVVGGTSAGDAGQASGFGGVWVGIQGTDVADTTAADGSFLLVGPIAGDRVLEFRAPDTTAPSTLNLTVLDGAITTLRDLHIIRGRVTSDEVRVTNVELQLDDDSECSEEGGTFQAHLTSHGNWTLAVVIQSDTEIHRVSGTSQTPLACSDLTTGADVNIRGVLTAPREITAMVVNRTKCGRPHVGSGTQPSYCPK